jgi:TetR/AcrR family transcriptional regulator, transcriptional repressor for nem operon
MSENAKEAILEAARRKAQAHGYGGLNLRDIAAEAQIKAASIYYHFPGKAELGAAVAKRYWEVAAAALEALSASTNDPKKALEAYPSLFRNSLEEDNRMCLFSQMAAETDDLPAAVKTEIQAFADVNVAWLTKTLAEACGSEKNWQPRGPEPVRRDDRQLPRRRPDPELKAPPLPAGLQRSWSGREITSPALRERGTARRA